LDTASVGEKLVAVFVELELLFFKQTGVNSGFVPECLV
jgi:hypothetical protein